MCCNNAVGHALRPYVLLPKLKTPTPDIRCLSESREVFIVSNDSAWMTGHAFGIWAIHFVHEVSAYRAELPPEIRTKRGLLIIDGATTHSTPWALDYLRWAGFTVLLLPAHSSHVLQVFDVVLAAVLKKQFRKKSRIGFSQCAS